MSNTFKDRLEIALAARNMKAVDLAEKTGINKARISQYVNGIYTPKSKATYLIAQALNVDEKWLMGFDVPMEKTESVQNSAPAPLLTEHEVTVALAYRHHPEEQLAVDKLLGITEHGATAPVRPNLIKKDIAAFGGAETLTVDSDALDAAIEKALKAKGLI